MKRKILDTMTFDEIFEVMCEENEIAFFIINTLLNYVENKQKLKLLKNKNLLEVFDDEVFLNTTKYEDILYLSKELERNFEQLITLDKREIRGKKIVKLFEDCCGYDIDKFNLTILALRFLNIYTDKEIKDNLNFTKPIPFIQDELVDYAYFAPLKRVEFYKKVSENKENVLKNMKAKRRKTRIIKKVKD